MSKMHHNLPVGTIMYDPKQNNVQEPTPPQRFMRELSSLIPLSNVHLSEDLLLRYPDMVIRKLTVGELKSAEGQRFLRAYFDAHLAVQTEYEDKELGKDLGKWSDMIAPNKMSVLIAFVIDDGSQVPQGKFPDITSADLEYAFTVKLQESFDGLSKGFKSKNQVLGTSYRIKRAQSMLEGDALAGLDLQNCENILRNLTEYMLAEQKKKLHVPAQQTKEGYLSFGSYCIDLPPSNAEAFAKRASNFLGEWYNTSLAALVIDRQHTCEVPEQAAKWESLFKTIARTYFAYNKVRSSPASPLSYPYLGVYTNELSRLIEAYRGVVEFFTDGEWQDQENAPLVQLGAFLGNETPSAIHKRLEEEVYAQFEEKASASMKRTLEENLKGLSVEPEAKTNMPLLNGLVEKTSELETEVGGWRTRLGAFRDRRAKSVESMHDVVSVVAKEGTFFGSGATDAIVFNSDPAALKEEMRAKLKSLFEPFQQEGAATRRRRLRTAQGTDEDGYPITHMHAFALDHSDFYKRLMPLQIASAQWRTAVLLDQVDDAAAAQIAEATGILRERKEKREREKVQQNTTSVFRTRATALLEDANTLNGTVQKAYADFSTEHPRSHSEIGERMAHLHTWASSATGASSIAAELSSFVQRMETTIEETRDMDT